MAADGLPATSMRVLMLLMLLMLLPLLPLLSHTLAGNGMAMGQLQHVLHKRCQARVGMRSCRCRRRCMHLTRRPPRALRASQMMGMRAAYSLLLPSPVQM